jgi:hypothetical protein
MPVHATQTGFANADDTLVKLITYPVPTAEHIFSYSKWTENAFRLDSIQVVTVRPQ